MDHLFDNLSRGMARGMSRRQVLKGLGAGIGGAVLAPLAIPGVAGAVGPPFDPGTCPPNLCLCQPSRLNKPHTKVCCSATAGMSFCTCPDQGGTCCPANLPKGCCAGNGVVTCHPATYVCGSGGDAMCAGVQNSAFCTC